LSTCGLTIRTLVSLIERGRTATPAGTERRHLETWCREQSGATGTPPGCPARPIRLRRRQRRQRQPTTDQLAATTGRSARTITRTIRHLTNARTITQRIMTGRNGCKNYNINWNPASETTRRG
jgi:hypothetical protein